MTPLNIAGLMADSEWRQREQRKLSGRLRTARFRQDACFEDIELPRGLQKAVMLDLAACRWVEAHQHVILTGQTGVGKS
jgi:DNA replication protein DnaC